jgi:hypothetical protein
MIHLEVRLLPDVTIDQEKANVKVLPIMTLLAQARQILGNLQCALKCS